MRRFSTETEAFLKKAGWRKGRAVNIDDYVQFLKNETFDIPKTVINFLREFGGLKVVHPHAKVPGKMDFFSFNVKKAIQDHDPLWVKEEYSNRVGKQLCIIGQAFRDYMVLSMSEDSEVFAGFDDILVYVGSSGDQAIENLCLGKELKEIRE
ncbi:MAG: SUKH-3 domain-containing protein [Candidatus Hodarchaeota archaeon]